MTEYKVRTKKELEEMRKKLHDEWNKVGENRTTMSRWIAMAYSLHTIDYALGKLPEPPVLDLIRRK